MGSAAEDSVVHMGEFTRVCAAGKVTALLLLFYGTLLGEKHYEESRPFNERLYRTLL